MRFLSLSLVMILTACSTTTVHQTSNDENLPTNHYVAKNVLHIDWPVDSARLTRGFIPYRTGKRRRPHWGIDLAAKKNSPIYAAHDGMIIYVGKEFRGFGKLIMIQGNQGVTSLYAHLEKISVKEGQHVSLGDRIGSMGKTGRATGVHLHFELRKNKGPINPLEYLPSKAFARR